MTEVAARQTAQEKFVRLANKRGESFKHQCKLLRNLATSFTYVVDPELAERLLEEFSSELETVKEAWVAGIAKVREQTEGPAMAPTEETSETAPTN